MNTMQQFISNGRGAQPGAEEEAGDGEEESEGEHYRNTQHKIYNIQSNQFLSC